MRLCEREDPRRPRCANWPQQTPPLAIVIHPERCCLATKPLCTRRHLRAIQTCHICVHSNSICCWNPVLPGTQCNLPAHHPMQQSRAALARLPGLLRASRCASGARCFASTASTQTQQTHKYDPYSVPAGHQNSDLGSIACNISLNRRRDLTLREDLKVVSDGKPATLASVMRVRTASRVSCMSRACMPG